MKPLLPLTDPSQPDLNSYSETDRLIARICRDPRDIPFVFLTLKITVFMIPLAILMYLPSITGIAWWLTALAYFVVNNFVFKGPFGLMLHCTSHRVLFSKKYGMLNHYLPWFIGPFFGQTPKTYYSHHIGMHHPENNLPDDISTTMPFRRDSLRGFLAYFTDFFFLVVIRLAAYFKRHDRKKLMLLTISGELFFILLVTGLMFVNWQATVMVFIVPFVLSRVVMMLGNWAQHAFVSGDDPGNAYKNSITCINTKYNHKCWNDGYHISHHVKPSMHWTEHPQHFSENIQEYINHKAIVFDGIHFLHVWVYLMRGRYDLLAKNFVNLGNHFQDDTEVITFLKSRTQKIIHSPLDLSTLK
ncbi:hypothetical protein BH11BAC2_BH11BAC2_10510 [soil metagenome]